MKMSSSGNGNGSGKLGGNGRKWETPFPSSRFPDEI